MRFHWSEFKHHRYGTGGKLRSAARRPWNSWLHPIMAGLVSLIVLLQPVAATATAQNNPGRDAESSYAGLMLPVLWHSSHLSAPIDIEKQSSHTSQPVTTVSAATVFGTWATKPTMRTNGLRLNVPPSITIARPLATLSGPHGKVIYQNYLVDSSVLVNPGHRYQVWYYYSQLGCTDCKIRLFTVRNGSEYLNDWTGTSEMASGATGLFTAQTEQIYITLLLSESLMPASGRILVVDWDAPLQANQIYQGQLQLPTVPITASFGHFYTLYVYFQQPGCINCNIGVLSNLGNCFAGYGGEGECQTAGVALGESITITQFILYGLEPDDGQARVLDLTLPPLPPPAERTLAPEAPCLANNPQQSFAIPINNLWC